MFLSTAIVGTRPYAAFIFAAPPAAGGRFQFFVCILSQASYVYKLQAAFLPGTVSAESCYIQ
jgi:hypothetical protein